MAPCISGTCSRNSFAYLFTHLRVRLRGHQPTAAARAAIARATAAAVHGRSHHPADRAKDEHHCDDEIQNVSLSLRGWFFFGLNVVKVLHLVVNPVVINA